MGLARIVNLLIYGGSTRLAPHEQRLLELARGVLPKSDRDVLEQQLDKLQRIKRYNDSRMITFQFDRIAVPLFEDRSSELCLVSILRAPKSGRGSAKPWGALIAHEGRLSSLELKSDPRALTEPDWSAITARYHGADPHVAAAIDREEHEKPAENGSR